MLVFARDLLREEVCFGELDVLTAESLSLLHGLLLCQERAIHGLLVEMDSKTLVRMLVHGRHPNGHFAMY